MIWTVRPARFGPVCADADDAQTMAAIAIARTRARTRAAIGLRFLDKATPGRRRVND